MRRLVVRGAASLVLILVVFTGVVIALNATLYSASGFVRSYLDALARRDAAGAIELAGVAVPAAAGVGAAADPLLDRGALAGLDAVRIVSDTARDDGAHEVTAAWRSPAGDGETRFVVEPAGPRLGVFSAWRFATAPVAELELTPRNASELVVNGVDVAGAEDTPTAFRVLVPGGYAVGHESRWLTADAVPVLAEAPGARVPAEVVVGANTAFVEQVQQEVDDYLDECATQRVLLPAGCPFGRPVDDRVESDPVWSIVRYPSLAIDPADRPDAWTVLPASGTARLEVDVRSLFDGTASTLDTEVPFSVGFTVTFRDDGGLLIQAG